MKKMLASFAAALGVFAMLFSATANAALDPAIATGLTGIQTDGTTLNGLVVPVMMTLLGMVIVIKLIKRFGNKI